MSPRDSSLGFTLIELLTVVALLAIFASIAVPSFSRMVEGNRLQSSAAEFYRALQSARSDAVSLRMIITACEKDDSTWEIRKGTDCNGDADDVTWTSQLPASVNLQSSATSIRFNPNGTAANVEITLSSDNAETEYAIELQASGFMRLTAEAAGAKS